MERVQTPDWTGALTHKPGPSLLHTLHAKLALALLVLLIPLAGLFVGTTMYSVNIPERVYILHLALWAVGLGLTFTVLAGWFMFNLLTRRLRTLTEAIEAFQKSDFQGEVPLPKTKSALGEDEIDRLGAVFTEMETRIQEQVQALRAADTGRRELIANISHDLRTPLAATRGYLETLLMKDEQLDPEERRRFLNTAFRHSEHLSRMVADLFDLAKLEAQPGLQGEPFRICELVYDVAEKYKLIAQERGVGLEVTQDHNVLVEGDIGLIERVLTNWLDNALRHTPTGGTVMLSLVERDNVATVRVTDTGQGIPPEDLPHIFDRFYRVEKNRPKDLSSTGLGLAITKLILELHQTHIQVESTLGVGTSFAFCLPIYGKEKSNCAPAWLSGHEA